MRLRIDRAAAYSVVSTGVAEIIPVKMPLVKIDMGSMFYSQSHAPGKDEGQVGISMAVSIGHAATHQGHGRVEQRLSVQIFGLGEPAMHTVRGEGAQGSGFPWLGSVMVTQFMPGLGIPNSGWASRPHSHY